MTRVIDGGYSRHLAWYRRAPLRNLLTFVWEPGLKNENWGWQVCRVRNHGECSAAVARPWDAVCPASRVGQTIRRNSARRCPCIFPDYKILISPSCGYFPRSLSAWIVAWRSSLCRKLNCANSNKATLLLQGDVERNLRVITTESNLHGNETLWLSRYRRTRRECELMTCHYSILFWSGARQP